MLFSRRTAAAGAGACLIVVAGAAHADALVASCPVSLGTLFGAAATTTLTASDPDGTVTSAAVVSPAVIGVTLVGFSPSAAIGAPATASLEVAAGTAIGTYDVQVQFSSNDGVPQTASCTVQVFVAVEVTGQVSVTTSPLHANNKGKDKGPFSGSLTITNTSSTPIAAPLQIELDGLVSGVTLLNAAGTHDGAPFLRSGATLAPGASLTLPVVFAVGDATGGDRGQGKDQGGGNDEKLAVYTVKVFSGTF